jgi:hypothetical protein
MPSFGDQLRAARQAHLAATALELTVRQQIASIFTAWEQGEYTPQSVRWALESVVRTAYRASAGVAAAHAQRQSGIPGWEPVEVFNTEYLQNLLSDVRRNLRDYKASDQGEAARRRVVFRTQHSAGVAAQRGYTDAMISAYTELADFGFRLRKVWLANFIGNTPCDHCRALHGTEVGLHEEFPTSNNRLKVYGDLLGPPRHPRCRCYLAILTVTLANTLETLDIDSPGAPPNTMTSDDVKNMPVQVFKAVVATLRSIIRRLRGL